MRCGVFELRRTLPFNYKTVVVALAFVTLGGGCSGDSSNSADPAPQVRLAGVTGGLTWELVYAPLEGGGCVDLRIAGELQGNCPDWEDAPTDANDLRFHRFEGPSGPSFEKSEVVLGVAAPEVRGILASLKNGDTVEIPVLSPAEERDRVYFAAIFPGPVGASDWSSVAELAPLPLTSPS